MIHGKLHDIDHGHQGELVGRRIHKADHVHFHVHVGGSDHETWISEDAAVGDGACADEVLLHAHVHVAVGGHELILGVEVFPHHSDRGEGVGTIFCKRERRSSQHDKSRFEIH